jgi:hypothetical protein
MNDTAALAEERYFELLRGQSPVQRLATMARLTENVRELALVDLRVRNPGAPPEQLRALLAERLYGRGVARRLFPSAW